MCVQDAKPHASQETVTVARLSVYWRRKYTKTNKAAYRAMGQTVVTFFFLPRFPPLAFPFFFATIISAGGGVISSSASIPRLGGGTGFD